jgi:regulator of protease activity HflC (stomatin/prohibitin superfamily)
MKKVTLMIMLAVAGISFTSCRGYEREQGELDATSKGKQQLNEARYSKQAKIETAKANKESAKLNAETQVIKAKANAEARIIDAQAEAKTRVMGAEAKAKANMLLNQSLTPGLIDYLEVERWNGVLPTTVAGSGANTIVGLK